MDDFAKVMMATHSNFQSFFQGLSARSIIAGWPPCFVGFCPWQSPGHHDTWRVGEGFPIPKRFDLKQWGLRVTVKLRVKHPKILRQHQVSPKFRHVSQGMNESKPLTHVFLFLFLFLKGSVSLSWIWHNMVLTWPKGLQVFILEVWLHPGEELV